MNGWQRIEPTVSTKIDYHHVIVKTFRQPNDSIVTRATFSSEDKRAAGVIAITKDRKIIIARQFRPGPERIFDEIPGGYVDTDEDPEMAARRELIEETGYTSGAMVYLGEFPRDAYANGRWYYYLATDCELVQKQSLDHDEFVRVELRDIGEFVANAKKGLMTDPYAVLAAYDQLMKIQKEGDQVSNEKTN
jgi:ADP-ribose pyrophosphatase